MKYIVGIGYANRLDLLHKAVDSIKPYWPHTIVVDNSDLQDLREEHELRNKVNIFEPPVPLSATQIFNYLLKRGMREGCDAVLFMHHDAEPHEGTPEKFLEILESWQARGDKWGVALTQYDILCAFNLKAVKEVGWWDTVMPNFFADSEYYRRMRMAGYSVIWTHLPVTHHRGQTTKSDPYRLRVFRSSITIHHDYYLAKWGGTTDKEVFTTPFNK
ncbi:glycosyltransferase family 2 protein [Paenibacillus sedimenti]|uniref:Glycosyltransferase family 2 protein n=1 Tax=Paenibacillus sedimenti TaxID=2770274 RepID=A0A926QKN4_9BACL|nr:glycosyltransferase family 2 protein [Paenibacillus sedimenti]MBD0381609.1 glycosyltransferase family 2 protein [Paenibacillus sedimenti]